MFSRVSHSHHTMPPPVSRRRLPTSRQYPFLLSLLTSLPHPSSEVKSLVCAVYKNWRFSSHLLSVCPILAIYQHIRPVILVTFGVSHLKAGQSLNLHRCCPRYFAHLSLLPLLVHQIHIQILRSVRLQVSPLSPMVNARGNSSILPF